jgi:hypothetical protein
VISVGTGRAKPRAWAAATMARAIGCCDA